MFVCDECGRETDRGKIDPMSMYKVCEGCYRKMKKKDYDDYTPERRYP